ITTQLGSQSATSQAHDAVGAMRYALRIAKVGCKTAHAGVLVNVRGLPIEIVLYDCFTWGMAHLCQKRTRNSAKIYACVVDFLLKAMVPVDPKERYYRCTRELFLAPMGPKGNNFTVVEPFFKWDCDPESGTRG
ncbi:MAG TPA: hypothetical protein VMR98_01905, partial [Candidatus Polarisedimenticolaceae bacterium]|nr:hypothetical protein [Candidatus Polarisedimenticolaceae bacterium]